jgi:hypothetical protein
MVLVTDDVVEGGGSGVRGWDRFHPVKSWVDEHRSVVGGLLPPGAVSVEVVDDRRARVAATVGDGAYVAVIEQPNDGYEPIVCCRDADGVPVRRPWAGEYPSVRVTDTEERCPACGAVDWDEYTPFEEWRGGRGSKVDGTHVANPVVSCRVCGHEEGEGTFYGARPQEDDSEDEEERAARLARADAQARKHRWLAGLMTLRATECPIYAADGWPARLGGSASRGDELAAITVRHYETPDADMFAGDRARLLVVTKREQSRPGDLLGDARDQLESWVHEDAGGARWPEASRAAITLWLRARDRKTRAAALDAVRSEQLVAIDGASTSMLTLTSGNRWVAVARHADLLIGVAGRDVDPSSLALEPVADPPARLLGPEPPDA